MQIEILALAVRADRRRPLATFWAWLVLLLSPLAAAQLNNQALVG